MMRCGWGNDAFTLFIVHKTQGLIKGAYSVEFGPGEGCERVFNPPLGVGRFTQRLRRPLGYLERPYIGEW